MAPRGGIFTAITPCLADITGAIEKIQAAIAAKTLKKKLFYDMLLGFQILEQSLQRKQPEAYNLILTWLNLFLNIQSNIITQNEGVREQFEKIVPSAVTYMIGCLQHKAKEIVSYHYQLLEMIHELLSNVRPGVLEKIATFETGIIACIWFPIAFVGDFNTQMMALRLLVMLLKCVDSKRLQNELDNIRCVDKSVMKSKLTAAISVANYHAAKFENTARDLLNTYNMHLAKNILVYSFRCKSFKFGDSIELFKPMNADDFWMDFNYCPRTLSFNGCCQTKNQTNSTNCSVNLQILKLSLNYLNLSIHFEAPLRHGNESTNFPDIAGITTAEIILPREEAMRLLENKFVLKYYNQPYRRRNESIVKLHKTSTPIPFQCMENVKETTANTNSIAIDDLMFKSNNNFANIASKDSAPPEVRNSTRVRQQQSNTQADSKSSPSNRGAVSKQFPKSFEFLIDVSKKINENVNPVALENNNISMIKKSSRPNEEQNHQKLSHLGNTGKQLCGGHLIDNIKKTAVAKLVNYSTSASESQLSSQKSSGSLNDIIIKPSQRRFFTTLNTNSESETISSKTKRMCRKRNARQDVTNASLKKSKQVNEVKPMLHSSKELNQTEISANNNRVINITNSDSNANEQNSITIYPTNSCSSNLGFDEYENLTVSDAEPGGSYRKFKTRRNSKGQTNNVAETQQSRKPLPRAVKKNVSSTFLLGRNSQLAQTKPVRKRLQCMDSFDEVKGQTSIPAKITKLSIHKNPTICSADIKNIADVVIRCCTSYKQNEVAQNSLTRTFARKKVGQILNTSLNPNEIPKTSAQSFQINVTSDETDESDDRNISADVTKVFEDKINDIQECRQNLYHKDNSSVHHYEEFSDCPNFSQLIDISDMLLSSECESTVLPGEITHPTNTLKSSNKQKPSDLPIKIYDFNMLKPHKSSIYRSRSDNDSDCEQSVNSSDRFEPTAQPLEPPQTLFVTPQPPLKKLQTTTSVTKRQVTATSTSIVTQQGRVVHQKCVVNLPASSNTPINLSKSCSRATTTTTKTIVQEKKEYSLNNSIQRPVKFMKSGPTPEALRQESSNMISTHKCNLNLLLEHMETNINRNSANAYIKKICDVAERVINEVERERKSLLELRESIGRLARQLDWQHDAYRRKTQQFECFKQNIDTLLRVLDNINLLEEIETDTQNKIQHLQQSSNSIATQQWRNFINETTANLLKDISTVSDL